jgi:hypothetical protein
MQRGTCSSWQSALAGVKEMIEGASVNPRARATRAWLSVGAFLATAAAALLALAGVKVASATTGVSRASSELLARWAATFSLGGAAVASVAFWRAHGDAFFRHHHIHELVADLLSSPLTQRSAYAAHGVFEAVAGICGKSDDRPGDREREWLAARVGGLRFAAAPGGISAFRSSSASGSALSASRRSRSSARARAHSSGASAGAGAEAPGTSRGRCANCSRKACA